MSAFGCGEATLTVVPGPDLDAGTPDDAEAGTDARSGGDTDHDDDGDRVDGAPDDDGVDEETADEGAPEDAGTDGAIVDEGDAGLPSDSDVEPPPDARIPADGAIDPPDGATDAEIEPPDAAIAPPDAAVDPPDAAPLPPCPEYDAPTVTGLVAAPEIQEASGIVESRRNPGVMWTHNDSGGTSRVFAFNTAGETLGIYELGGARPRDWEDLAVGPGPDPNLTYLYMGDIGDNFSRRDNLSVRRFAEPRVVAAPEPPTVQVEGVEIFTLVYPDGAHNSETIMVDSRTGDLYIVVKSGDGVSPVFRAAAPLSAEGVIELEHVADLQFGPAPLRGSANTTAGDISPSGDAILIRTYSSVYLWRRGPNATIAQAFGTEPCPMPAARERQGEAICFAEDGSGYYTVSEGPNPPLNFYERL